MENNGSLAANSREIEIRPRAGWIAVDWKELWTSRELFYFLILRDVKVRYKQTVLGVAWAALQPLITMILFTLIFGRFAKIPSDGVPYAAFVLAGLLPWALFSNIVTQASQSLLNQQGLLTKIYLPRLFIPSAPLGTGLIDLMVSFLILFVVMAYMGLRPSFALVMALPILTAVALLAALGVGIGLAALTVSYRDFRYVVPFLIQCWMYVSPVVYPLSVVPSEWHWLLALNPMTGVIDGYRSALFGLPWNWIEIAVSAATSVMFFLFGVRYFRMTERRFADIA